MFKSSIVILLLFLLYSSCLGPSSALGKNIAKKNSDGSRENLGFNKYDRIALLEKEHHRLSQKVGQLENKVKKLEKEISQLRSALNEKD